MDGAEKMTKILVFRTAQNHICEKVLLMIKKKYPDSLIDYLSNQDYESKNVIINKKYIIDYQGFLDIKYFPISILKEIKKVKYDIFIFPYSIWGTKSLANLLKIVNHSKPKKILFVNELEEGKEKNILQLNLCFIRDYAFNSLLFIPMFMLTLLAYLKNILSPIIKDYRVKAEIKVIRGTTNLEIEKPVKKQNNLVKIGCIARLDPIKGHKYLLKAFYQLVIEGFENVELILIGGGSELLFIKELINRYNIGEQVRCVGNQENVIPYLKECDIFVLPSLNEAMPISLLEVMAAGKPIIASRVGDIPNIINDHENGILINPKCENDIYLALKELILNQELRYKIGLNAYETFHQKFSARKFAEEYSRFYQEIIKANNQEEKEVWVFTVFSLVLGGITSYILLLKSSIKKFKIEVPIMPKYINFTVKSFYLERFPNIFRCIFPGGKQIAHYTVRKIFILYVFLIKCFKGKPDLIHVHDVISYNALKLICRLFSIPLVLTKHGDLAKEVLIKNGVDKNSYEYKYFSNQEKTAYQNAEYLIVVDEETKKRLSNGEIA